MNRSGGPLRKFLDRGHWRLKRNPQSAARGDDLIILYDDVSLPFGTIAVRHKVRPERARAARSCVGDARWDLHEVAAAQHAARARDADTEACTCMRCVRVRVVSDAAPECLSRLACGSVCVSPDPSAAPR